MVQAPGGEPLVAARGALRGRRPHAERRRPGARGARGRGRAAGASWSTTGCARASRRSTPRGDVAGRFLFTHSAGYEAVRAVRDMFFPGKGKADDLVPWCTFTDPELAHAGLTIAQARASTATTSRSTAWTLAHSDRARADGATTARSCSSPPRSKLVGAHILAPAAGRDDPRAGAGHPRGHEAGRPGRRDPRLPDAVDRRSASWPPRPPSRARSASAGWSAMSRDWVTFDCYGTLADWLGRDAQRPHPARRGRRRRAPAARLPRPRGPGGGRSARASLIARC